MTLTSIKVKFPLTTIVVIWALLFLMGGLFLRWTVTGLQHQLQERVKGHARGAAQIISMALERGEGLVSGSQLAMRESQLGPGAIFQVCDERGRLVLDSRERGKPQGAFPEKGMEALTGPEVSWATPTEVHFSLPIQVAGTTVGGVDYAISVAEIQPEITRMRKILLLAMLPSLALGIFLSLALSRTLLSPLERLGGIARRLAEGDFSERAGEEGRTDEIGTLARAMNLMSQEIQRKIGELEREKAAMATLLSSQIDGVVALNPDGEIVFMNPLAEQALRVEKSEAIGKKLSEVWPNLEILYFVEEGRRGGEVVGREVALTHNVLKLFLIPIPSLLLPGLSEHVPEGRSPVVVEGSEGESAVMLVFRDVTELRHLEDLRAQFLSHVSHELRTPLTIIKGDACTLKDDPDLEGKEKIQRILSRIESESDRLSRLVEELLELSRLKGKKVPLELLPASISELVKETLEGFLHHAERYQVTLETHLPSEKLQALVDPNRIRQVLLNLLDNAMKFTPSGGKVDVTVRKEEGEVILEIQDSGVGIPREQIPYLFDRFFQGAPSPQSPVHGSQARGWGLGLPIVKEIVESHGGKISVESEVGKGTTMMVRFPLIVKRP